MPAHGGERRRFWRRWRSCTPSPTAFAQCIANETQRISPQPQGVLGGFGFSAAISGDVAVIDTTSSGGRPKAYVFRYDGGQWSSDAEFLRPMQGPQGNRASWTHRANGLHWGFDGPMLAAESS